MGTNAYLFVVEQVDDHLAVDVVDLVHDGTHHCSHSRRGADYSPTRPRDRAVGEDRAKQINFEANVIYHKLMYTDRYA